MEFVIGAASWALGKALASAKDTLAETWAASKGIGDNLEALEMELLHAQWILDHPHVKESRSPPIAELLVKLRQVAYDADDVLDELEYYRIQDDLDGTQHATNMDDDGGGLLLHARSTANAIGKRLTCCSFPSADDDPRTSVLEEDPNTPANGWEFFSCAWPSRAQHRKHDRETQKLKFDRVDMSTKMKNIVDKLKPLCAKLTTILDIKLLGYASPKTANWNARNRPVVSTETIKQKIFGRPDLKKSICYTIVNGEYSTNQLTVLPVVGPGGIGKTTLIQHIYQELNSYFDISIWICVSINFNADRLAEEIVKQIPRVNGQRETASDQEAIEQRLKAKRFLLVLDDVWTCKEDEWLQLLAPFRKVVGTGNMIIVTTRSPSVANMVQTVDSPISLNCLEDQDFRLFFFACVFRHLDFSALEADPRLYEVGLEIMKKLKGSPLAAKTVGKLLANEPTLEHWRSVLESREWEQTSGDHDIMPALKLSYNYLPFHLQQCFSYLAMFPEDYEFGSEELICLWMGQGILNSQGENKRAEDIGQSYLIDLVNHGFLKKCESDYGSSYYILHDLLHELAMKVQSKECIRIDSSNIMSTKIPLSVRHLSIIVDVTDVKHKVSFECYKKNLSTLDRRLNIQKLRTLMLFGKHHGSFANIFGDMFRNARALRTIFLHGASYAVEDILCNFSRLVHLRYLKIESLNNEDICIPALCRLYHLQMVDLHGWKGLFGSTTRVSNLGNLRHFLVPDDAMHSEIFEVGKLKSLQELKRFVVRNDIQGFELGQLGDLVELGGSLQIGNLERVKGKEEAGEAKLFQKKHLDKLILDWDSNRSNKDSTKEDQVLESLMPSSNLRKLCIRGHGGTNFPSWLGEYSSRYLELLQLHDVSWNNLPLLGELWLVDEHGAEFKSYIQEQRFSCLKRLELVKISKLKSWVSNGSRDLFFNLEILIIKDCPQLIELPFRHDTECGPEHKDHMSWFPRLQDLEIVDCPKLSSLPRIPWARSVFSVKIEQVDSSFEQLLYRKLRSGCCLEIEGKNTSDTAFWTVLEFDYLTEVQVLEMKGCPPLSMDHLQMLSSLQTLKVHGSSNAFWLAEVDGGVSYEFPVRHLTIQQCGASGEQLTHLLSCMPKLHSLNVGECEKLRELGVVDKQKETEAPAEPQSDSIEELENTQIGMHQQQQRHQQDAGAEEEILAPPPQGLLLLPPQLGSLSISNCPNLVLCPVSLDAGGGGGGLQGLSSLRSLKIHNCPRFLSSSSSCFPFPASLEEVSLQGAVGTETLLPLSNLTTLTDLSIKECGDLRGEGLWPLLTQGRLIRLTICETHSFFAGFDHPLPHEQESASSSSKLQELWTDDVAGVLAVPICTFLSSSLTKLYFSGDKEVKRLEKEQEQALLHLTSLKEIRFWLCDQLQCLPAGLHGLPTLKRLNIRDCPAIRSLHKDGLPSSLLELVIDNCPAIRSLPKDFLPSSLQELMISNCSSIKSLPKDGLPSSLQKLVIKGCPAIQSLPKVNDLPMSLLELNVRDSQSKKLRRQCHKLIGTIPVVYA